MAHSVFGFVLCFRTWNGFGGIFGCGFGPFLLVRFSGEHGLLAPPGGHCLGDVRCLVVVALLGVSMRSVWRFFFDCSG